VWRWVPYVKLPVSREKGQEDVVVEEEEDLGVAGRL
jgi:hypothetical protein